jgi:hypothetical protein
MTVVAVVVIVIITVIITVFVKNGEVNPMYTMKANIRGKVEV